MYKNRYQIYVVCKASQVVTLDHDGRTLNYHEVDEIYDNEHLQIYDATNECPVGHIDNNLHDDEELYRLAHEMITEYEDKEQRMTDYILECVREK